jgi:UDP-GlcNAc:undecaprenyl-phosphate GlcNAc-1-phosphate transferase
MAMFGTTVLAAGAFAAAMALSAAGTAWMRRLSGRWHLVAAPGGHRGHDRPMPAGGGVAILAAVVLPLAAVAVGAAILRWAFGDAPPAWVPQLVARHAAGVIEKLPMLAGLLGGAVVLHALGLIDDRRDLPFKMRLAVQVAVAATAVFVLGIRVTLFLPPAWQWAAGLASVLWIVAITNAFNFMDNMDGLAAGVGGIVCVALSGACSQLGQLFVPGALLVVAGALAGFLIFNFPPAKIYMGNGGSGVVGYLIGCLSMLGTYYSPAASAQPATYAVLIPLIVLAVPLYDVATVIVLRLREGRSPFVGDRRHLSHRLAARGLSVRNAVLTIYLITFITAVTATSLTRADGFTAALILMQLAAILTVLAVLEHPFLRAEPPEAQR